MTTSQLQTVLSSLGGAERYGERKRIHFLRVLSDTHKKSISHLLCEVKTVRKEGTSPILSALGKGLPAFGIWKGCL